MPPTNRGGNDDDDRAFEEAMRGARPIERGPARVAASPSGPARRKISAAPAPSPSPFIVEQTADTITGRARDVAAKVLRELRSGAQPIDARLDLHGRARGDAMRELERFVASSAARGTRALLVIHGRGRGSDAGGPVLRPAVWEWLAGTAAERAGIMAFTSARPRDGGDGATLVLLRRSAPR